MSLKLRVRKKGDVPILDIDGEITGKDVGKVAARLDSLRKTNSKTVVVDLSRTLFIDSPGLGAFVYCRKVLQTENKEIVLLNPQGFVRTLLNGTNLDKVFRIIVSENEL